MINRNIIKIIPSGLTKLECELLNDWVLKNYNTEIFQIGKVANNRKTTRFTKGIEYEYPESILTTFKKIKSDLGLLECENIPQGNGGIICAISFTGSRLQKHTDPNYENTESLHFIIKTSEDDDGGDLIINNVVYKLNQGECLYFFASIHEHETNILQSSKYRIVWINGIKIII